MFLKFFKHNNQDDNDNQQDGLRRNHKKKKEKQKAIGFGHLSENVFPYACLVADNVLLTKNGEVMQMIEISLDDFKLNQEGGLRDKIRNAIADNTNDLKTAFWVQTIKRKKGKQVQSKKVIKHELLRRFYNVWKEKEEGLNNYSTSVYITIIRQGRNFKLKYFKDYLSATFLSYKHDKFIDNSINEIRSITDNIFSMLAVYHPKILGIRKDGENIEYSELLETLYFIINFQFKQIKVSPVDATKLINRSRYFFENGIMAMQSQENDKILLGMSFSLKEVPRITMSNVSDIVNNTRAEMVITEYVSYVEQSTAQQQFREQQGFLAGRDDKKFQEDVGLGFLSGGENTKYCQSSLSVMIYAQNISELQVFVTDAIKMFSKHGIVMAREDVSLERNYYAMMPANFGFTHRLTIHDAKEVGCFCYSYTPQESDAKNFLQEKVLFNIGTLKSNPVAVGLDKIYPNIMISGLQNSGKTTIANFIASAIMREFDANICIIEFTCRSRAFIDLLGGQWYSVSMKKQNHTALFNALNLSLFNNDDKKRNYLYEMMSLLLSANNVIVTPEIASEIKKAIESILDYAKTHKQFALHDVRGVFNGLSLEQELQSWHSIGRYYHLLDNREDVFNMDDLLAFYIDESIQKNDFVLATIINHLFTSIVQKAKYSTKPTVVILDEPFLAFGNGFFKNKLNKLVERMTKNNVFCIYKVSNLEEESATIVDFSQLVNSCGTQIHFANKYADKNYGRVFRLEKLEYMAVHALSGYEGRNLILKQGKDIYSCNFELDDYPKTLSVLSDKGEAQGKIFTIKETLQTDDYERIVHAYFGQFNINDNAEAQRKIKQEIKAIQDIKRLMES